MKYKYVILALLIGLMVGCLAKYVPPVLEFRDGSLVVFDGGTVKQGKGFALPRGISKLEVSYENPKTNKNHLYYDLKLSDGWTGGGWNWYSWEGKGTNIKDYNNLFFHIAVSPANISDLTFQLTSKNKNGVPDGMGPKVSILPLITKRGKYIQLTIPLEKLRGGNLDETVVWGFNFGVFAGKTGSSEIKIFFDQIEFTK